jgi:nicotinate dehydrogenase subunit A
VTTPLLVNGEVRRVAADPETPLLYVLRNELGLKGPRFGCGTGHCGACMVLVEGEARQACDIPLSAVGNSAVVTIEGLSQDTVLHPLQRAFLAEQAAQCGFCTAGIIIAAKALLDANPRPNEQEIRVALQDNLCRCGSHARVLRAVVRASEEMFR